MFIFSKRISSLTAYKSLASKGEGCVMVSLVTSMAALLVLLKTEAALHLDLPSKVSWLKL